MRTTLAEYFEFERLNTGWRTEILAGFTTFMTMAYIVFVNPSILADAGMPRTAVVAATCLSAALGSILMGAFARYPIAMAPGMGLNAYFAYTVVQGMGVSWQTALGAVLISGVAFLVLTATGVRQLVLAAVPADLLAAVAVGIGLFLAFIGFRNSGIILPDPATTVKLGNLTDPHTALAVFGLLLISLLYAWGVRASMILGILGTTGVGVVLGLVEWAPQSYSFQDITATAFQLDLRGALHLGLAEIVFIFLFVDLFDNLGTLVAVCKTAGISDEPTRLPRINRILFADAAATIAGSMAGTSTVCSYVESAAGVVAGGRTGVPAIVTGLLFVLAMFIAPVVGAIPAAATAPALIVVGCMMANHAREIKWSDPLVAIPAFLTMTMIPLTYSIANGLALGFIAHTLLRMLRGQYRTVSWLAYLLTVLLIARFVYLGQGG